MLTEFKEHLVDVGCVHDGQPKSTTGNRNDAWGFDPEHALLSSTRMCKMKLPNTAGEAALRG